MHKPRFTMKTLQYSTLRRWILLWKTEMLNSSPVSATMVCDQKRYHTGNPEASTVSGFFRAFFRLHKKKIIFQQPLLW